MLRNTLLASILFCLGCCSIHAEIPRDSNLTGEVRFLPLVELERFGIEIEVSAAEADKSKNASAAIIRVSSIDAEFTSLLDLDITIAIVTKSGEVVSIGHPVAIDVGDMLRVESPYFLRIGLSAGRDFNEIENGVLYLIDVRLDQL